jgi:hypothetical protein
MSSRHGGQSMSHPIITLHFVWCISQSNSWSTSLVLTNFSWKLNQCSKSHFDFFTQIYHSLTRDLHKLCRMALTLELLIPRLPFHRKIRSIQWCRSLILHVLSTFITSSSWIQLLLSWLHLVVSSPCICGILQLSWFIEVLKYSSLCIDWNSVPSVCTWNKWYGWGSSSRYLVCSLCCPFLDICPHNALAPCIWSTTPCYCLSSLSSSSSFWVSLRQRRSSGGAGVLDLLQFWTRKGHQQVCRWEGEMIEARGRVRDTLSRWNQRWSVAVSAAPTDKFAA